MFNDNQYFNELIPLTDHEIYVDGGMYDGDTINEFLDIVSGKYNKIYGFEPFSELFHQAKESLEKYSDVFLYQAGLYDRSGRIGFNERLPLGGTRVDYTLDDSNSIEILSLDSIADEATFIKMDIEGSELAALRGAKNLIQQYRPKLAICVYHNYEDLLTIPEYVSSLNPNYKLYLRHHGTGELKHQETVLYAV